MINVDYVRPKNIDEAIERMAADEFIPIGSGTNPIPQLRNGKGCRLLDIGGFPLDFIRDDGEWIEIGAGTIHAETHQRELIEANLPLVGQACGLFGSSQIRIRGTLRGNIANASPCADSVPALPVYDAEIKLTSRAGEHRIRLAEFIRGSYRIDRRPEKLIISILCRKTAPATGGAFLKLGRRQAVNISKMNIVAIISIGQNNIALRLLYSGYGDSYSCPAAGASESRHLQDKIGAGWQFLPLHRLPTDDRRRQAGGQHN